MPPKPTNAFHDWWRILSMGTVLAGVIFFAFFYRSGDPIPATDGPAIERIRVATPKLDSELLALAKDAERHDRLVIEAKPLAHLLEKSIDIVPSVARALGMPKDPVPIASIRRNPPEYRGRYLWYKGELRYLSRGKAGHPVGGFNIYEGWLRTDDEHDVLFRVSIEPRNIAVGDHVRIEGFFMKLHDSHDLPNTTQAPILVGPELFIDFPPWTPVTELDAATMAQLDDHYVDENGNVVPRPHVDEQGHLVRDSDVWDTLAESQQLPLWHLTSYARTRTGELDDTAWRQIPAFVRKDQLDRVRLGEMARGEPLRVLGEFMKGHTWEARPNPLGVEHWSEALVRIHDLGGKIVPIWVPSRLDVKRGAWLDVRGFYFRRQVYEALTGDIRITPVFVAESLHGFEPIPEHAVTSAVRWSFVGLVVIVIALFFSVALIDRKRQVAHKLEMDERRRRRATRSAIASDS